MQNPAAFYAFLALILAVLLVVAAFFERRK
jgi:hypothetical protein